MHAGVPTSRKIRQTKHDGGTQATLNQKCHASRKVTARGKHVRHLRQVARETFLNGTGRDVVAREVAIHSTNDIILDQENVRMLAGVKLANNIMKKRKIIRLWRQFF